MTEDNNNTMQHNNQTAEQFESILSIWMDAQTNGTANATTVTINLCTSLANQVMKMLGVILMARIIRIWRRYRRH